ncbi:MAG: hypothetical protein HY654_04995 [Acidobacteria bacterium]|nr:hypothetical protein [Acidobacteriota bacterium]
MDRLRRLFSTTVSAFMEEIHQIPVKAFPHATAIVKRQRQNGERSFRKPVAVDFVGEFTRPHFVFSRS